MLSLIEDFHHDIHWKPHGYRLGEPYQTVLRSLVPMEDDHGYRYQVFRFDHEIEALATPAFAVQLDHYRIGFDDSVELLCVGFSPYGLPQWTVLDGHQTTPEEDDEHPDAHNEDDRHDNDEDLDEEGDDWEDNEDERREWDEGWDDPDEDGDWDDIWYFGPTLDHRDKADSRRDEDVANEGNQDPHYDKYLGHIEGEHSYYPPHYNYPEDLDDWSAEDWEWFFWG